MNPLLKRILIILGSILAVLAIGALVVKGVRNRGKWNKKHDRYSERSNCCKCCSSDEEDDDDDDDEEESHGKMMKKHGDKEKDMPMMKKKDQEKKD